MHKKFIAMAVAGLTSAAAFAQSNVTIYGLIDYGYAYRFDARSLTGQGPTPNSSSQLNSGQSQSSRIGFKGSEDLGNGLKAVFLLEQGFFLDTGAENTPGLAFNRQAYLGLEGNFGSVRGGRMYTPYYSFVTALDPFGNGTVGRWSNAFKVAPGTQNGGLLYPVRFDNAIIYNSPSFGGFTVTGAFSNNYSGQENSASNAANNTFYAVLGKYDNGPIAAGASYHYIAGGTSAAYNSLGSVQTFALGGAYDFKAVKVMALWSWNDINYTGRAVNADNATVNDYMIGATIPFGKWTGKASYIYSDGNKSAGGDAQQLAVGLDYRLSKRTNLYGAYSWIDNSDKRMSAVNDASNDADYSSGNGYRAGGVWQQGFQVGIKHLF